MRLHVLVTFLFFAELVRGHGFVYKVTIDSETYTGNFPASDDPFSSVVRGISTADPVMNATNPDLNCGPAASLAQEVADAQPGSTLSFDWREANLSWWPHNTGPMLTYMTSCGSTSCAQYNSPTAKWFKIQQIGRKTDGSGQWAQADLMTGGLAVVTLPSNIASGNYLIRHEIIALHQANVLQGAQFYPSCTQLRVGGNQTGTPDENDLVTLPGAYHDDDPGLYDPNNNFYDPSANYTFPGPPIAAFASLTTSPGSTSPPGSASPPPSTSNSTQDICRLKRDSSAISLTVASVLNLPRDLCIAFKALGEL